MAQNTRHRTNVINDLCSYDEETIMSLFTSDDCIVNVDETSLDFEVTAKITLEKRGSRTMPIKKSGSNQRCTVVLDVTKNEETFSCFPRNHNGRIRREFTKLPYRIDCAYFVQKAAWVDSSVFNESFDKILVSLLPCDQKFT